MTVWQEGLHSEAPHKLSFEDVMEEAIPELQSRAGSWKQLLDLENTGHLLAQ